ncbi:MAG TPA: ATP-binding cassette domain-containing protein [Phycisphaerae bacterium]|nr:ATP-binding cassette domain-containing protein [Phycisphaerae bacterium]
MGRKMGAPKISVLIEDGVGIMLSVEHLSFSFGCRTILNRASFRLGPGVITCLMGENGSGKTTLLNLIGGFLRPDSGSICLGDQELVGRAPFQISRLGVARSFQDLRLIGKLSVRENVLLALPRQPGEGLARAIQPRSLYRASEAADHEKASVLLTDFFLAEIADQLASEISYGQQKLLTLACCSAMDTNLILLDEPVAGISHEHREHIVNRLVKLKTEGKIILLIDHQTDFLQNVGNSFFLMEAGRLHHFDTLAELRAGHVMHGRIQQG